jgi:hypothetical protein
MRDRRNLKIGREKGNEENGDIRIKLMENSLKLDAIKFNPIQLKSNPVLISNPMPESKSKILQFKIQVQIPSPKIQSKVPTARSLKSKSPNPKSTSPNFIPFRVQISGEAGCRSNYM